VGGELVPVPWNTRVFFAAPVDHSEFCGFFASRPDLLQAQDLTDALGRRGTRG
jgi:hypothetical protein